MTFSEYVDLLQTFFSTNEIQLLTHKKKRVNWTAKEISKAIALRVLSRKAYTFVRDTMKFPLPGIRIS